MSPTLLSFASLVLGILPGAADPAAPGAIAGPDAVLVLHLEGGGELVDAALASGLYAQANAWPEWQEALRRPDARKARMAFHFVAGLLGVAPAEAARLALGEEAVFALRAFPSGPPQVLAMVRCADAATASRLERVVHEVAMLAGAAEGLEQNGPIRSANGREFHALARDRVFFCTDRAWLEQALDRAAALQPGGGGKGGAPRLRAAIDLGAFRAAGKLPPLPERYDNALPALLLHGVFRAVARADEARIEASLDHDELRVTASVPLPDDVVQEEEWFFTAPPADPLPRPRDAALWLSAQRDFQGFYARRFELLQEDLEDEVLEFDSAGALFFGGRSFADEVLAGFGRQALLVLAPPAFPSLPRPPQVQLPAFALVAPLATGRLRPTDLHVAFQTAIGLVNADRAQNGLDPLLLSSEPLGSSSVSFARYLLEEDEGGPLPLRFNAEPALAVHDGVLLLGSSRTQVTGLAAALEPAGGERLDAHTELALEVVPALDLLDRNRAALVAQRMLDHGVGEAEAERFFDRLRGLLALFSDLHARMHAGDGELEVDLRIRARPEDVR